MSCGYTGTHFGASYPDGVCIDGFLWDLDSCDGEYLSSGGDLPCPSCALSDWISMMIAQALQDSINNGSNTQEPCDLIIHALLRGRAWELHGLHALLHAISTGALRTLWFGGTGPGEDNDPVARLAWPWPLDPAAAAHLTHHQRMQVAEATARAPALDGHTPDADGRMLAPIQPGDW